MEPFHDAANSRGSFEGENLRRETVSSGGWGTSVRVEERSGKGGMTAINRALRLKSRRGLFWDALHGAM